MSAMRGDYESLRGLLLDDERQRLDGIDRRLDALPETVAESLELAVRRKPDTVVNAVFPVIGPAIRRALVEALRHMATDFDQALSDTLSLKALRWRFEAWRTGVPYAQVVLRQRLRYQVEHLFLIQRESGLLLDHLSASGVPAIDPDAVAGMLTAIAQFVHDSVRAEGPAQLGSASVGEYRLLISDGPHARLAALVKGVPPSSLATRMDELGEELHALHGKRLEATPDGSGGLLEPGLLAGLHQVNASTQKTFASHGRWILFALLVLLAGALSYRLWTGWQWSQRVASVRTELERWPGFVLLHAESPRRGELAVGGLYDPLAGDPRAVDRGMSVHWSLRPYMSLEPPLVASRPGADPGPGCGRCAAPRR
ncbi:hypothetical protein [Luteibacter sp. Lutesp34]|uniref:hypothetical protein n=1 Tax=Luteibacter sp. Lutesp34 TaxID=3243030 RepID=UPI0039B54885